VGVKMLLTDTAYKIPTPLSLGIVAIILAVAVVASLVRSRSVQEQTASIEPVAGASIPSEKTSH
jgi:tellurite resistance protein TerC